MIATYELFKNLQNAKDNQEELEKLIEDNDQIIRDDYNKNFTATFLHRAAKYGYTAIVKAIIAKHPAALDARDYNNATPLHIAAKYGYTAIVKAIIAKHPAALDARDHNNATPLHIAANNLKTETVVAIITAVPEALKCKDGYDQTILHIVAWKAGIDMAEAANVGIDMAEAENAGIDIAEAENAGIDIAEAENAGIDIAEAAIKVDPTILLMKDSSENTALDIAIFGKNSKIIKLLQDKQLEYAPFVRFMRAINLSNKAVGAGAGLALGFLAACALRTYTRNNVIGAVVCASGTLLGLATSYLAKSYVSDLEAKLQAKVAKIANAIRINDEDDTIYDPAPVTTSCVDNDDKTI